MPSPKKPPNRGRLQAQGGGIEKSVSWAQDSPPTVAEALGWLDQLAAQLRPHEYEERAEAFAKAEEFIRRAGACGGVDAVVSKSWPPKAAIRVDIEVKVGRAFVP